MSASFACTHFLWMIWGFLRGHSPGAAVWLVGIDIIAGGILRCMTGLIAKLWNNGSWLQVGIAFVSPTFWSVAYAGHKAIDVSWVWRTPLLVRVISGLACLGLNATSVVLEHKVADMVLLVIGLLLGINGSFELSALRCLCLRSRSANFDVNFLFMASLGHFYALLTHVKLLARGEIPGILVVLGDFAASEALCLLRIAHDLDAIMSAETVERRVQRSGERTLLAGSLMLCDIRKGIEETFSESPCIRTYVTWVVRGTVPGAWSTMAILLPGPWGGNCDITAKDVAFVETGEEGPIAVCCTLSIQSSVFDSGNTCVALDPVLTRILRRADALGLQGPSTLYVKNDTGFLRAVGAGIVGLPIF